MAVVHSYVPPERFVVGTVGEPGSRTFFLQARSGPRMTSVSLEKQQVVALGERIDQLLDDLMAAPENAARIPAVTPRRLHDSGPLEQPIVEEFRVGTMTLSWDDEATMVVVEVFPFEVEEPVEEESATFEEYRDAVDALPDDQIPDELADELAEALADVLSGDDFDEMMLVRLSPAQARAFAERARVVVSSGRPTCPFCSEPMDPSGHLCVRANGFRRRLS